MYNTETDTVTVLSNNKDEGIKVQSSKHLSLSIAIKISQSYHVMYKRLLFIFKLFL